MDTNTESATALTPDEALVVHAILMSVRDERFIEPQLERALVKLHKQAHPEVI